MISEYGVFLAGVVGMGMAVAAVDAALPGSRRSWWRGRARHDYAPRGERVATGSDDLSDVSETAYDPRGLTDLHLVETVERRSNALPFVGRDRRQAAEAPADGRRQANGE